LTGAGDTRDKLATFKAKQNTESMKVMPVRELVRLSAPLAALAALTAPATAHPGHASFEAGFLHWLTSADHALAMVAVGVTAAAVAGHVSRASGRAALRVGGGAIAALGVALLLI
jgi:urease accessory protein